MFSKELEEIIDAALADGELSEKERAVILKRALAEGVDADELDIVLNGRLAKMKKQEQSAQHYHPQALSNQKIGDVVKCPSCGAQVVGGSAVCKECGYTFSNVSANSSVERLQRMLYEYSQQQDARTAKHPLVSTFGLDAMSRVSSIKHKMGMIAGFPVPNTRADLLEFLTMTQANANSTGPRGGHNTNYEEDLGYAYWQLYTNCINKAKLSFSKDADFIPFFEHYEQELSKTKGIIGYLKGHPRTRMIVFSLLFLLLMFLTIFLSVR